LISVKTAANGDLDVSRQTAFSPSPAHVVQKRIRPGNKNVDGRSRTPVAAQHCVPRDQFWNHAGRTSLSLFGRNRNELLGADGNLHRVRISAGRVPSGIATERFRRIRSDLSWSAVSRSRLRVPRHFRVLIFDRKLSLRTCGGEAAKWPGRVPSRPVKSNAIIAFEPLNVPRRR